MRPPRTLAFILVVFASILWLPTRSHAQAALIMAEPYGFFGTLNPTGHTAIYFANICAETPTRLRRCHAGEMGSVISRYSDVGQYDWIAVPLIPYLYSVEDPSEVPARVDRVIVNRLRDQYHEAHLEALGDNVRKGSFWHGGWTELIGVAYERRLYAFRFDTTPAEDDALIERMNSAKNESSFQLLFNNCADFTRDVLNQYFPKTFRRSVFPDAGMTTPKQIAYKLERYAKKHPQLHLQIFEIPQIPGYRHKSRSNKSISESLITTAYAVPIAIVNPYLAGGLFVDYVIRGRHHLIPKNLARLTPDEFDALTVPSTGKENPLSASAQVHSAAVAGGQAEVPDPPTANSGLKEVMTTHE